MRILIDIGHPAHVHYFKNFIRIMQQKGHEFCISARDKEFVHLLLKDLNLPYSSRGKGGKGILGKLMYILKGDKHLLKLSAKFKPDIFMSFASPYAAQVAWLRCKPHIVFDDTEHAKFGQMMYAPFSDCILTPDCFGKDFGKKHIRFNSYMELCYLHPDFFSSDKNLVSDLFAHEFDKTIILRFVSWEAHHDIGKNGLSFEYKINLVRQLSKLAKVWISSENDLPEELQSFRYPLPPQTMHHALACCDLFIGEGVTMASECAVLGTPAFYINALPLGYATQQEENYKLVYNFRTTDGLLEKIKDVLSCLPENKEFYNQQRQKLLAEKISLTNFMVWFVENFPNSKHEPFKFLSQKNLL